MSGNIILSKEHGVNPHLCVCPNCGKENGELVLTGAAHVYKHRCGMRFIGKPSQGYCPKCKDPIFSDRLEDLGEMSPEDRVPTSICIDCAHNFAICDEEVRNGGVPWRCKDCGSMGAIKANTALAKEWRKRNGGQLVGLEVGKDQCSVCGGGHKS